MILSKKEIKMKDKYKEFMFGFAFGCIISSVFFGTILLCFISSLEKFKQDAVNYHHAEYVINNNGQIEFRWKKLLEY
jgi:hypothetical protein